MVPQLHATFPHLSPGPCQSRYLRIVSILPTFVVSPVPHFLSPTAAPFRSLSATCSQSDRLRAILLFTDGYDPEFATGSWDGSLPPQLHQQVPGIGAAPDGGGPDSFLEEQFRMGFDRRHWPTTSLVAGAPVAPLCAKVFGRRCVLRSRGGPGRSTAAQVRFIGVVWGLPKSR